MKQLEFYFDFSSPFAYLGAMRVRELAAKTGAELVWKPMFLGGVFKAIGTPMVPLFDQCQAKQDYLQVDLLRWAAYHELSFSWPSRFPMMTITPLRMTVAMLKRGDDPWPLIETFFTAYWAEDRDIADKSIIAELAASVGVEWALEAARDPEIKAALVEATDQAVAASVFGAPTCIVDGEVFWGQDRFTLVEAVLAE